MDPSILVEKLEAGGDTGAVAAFLREYTEAAGWYWHVVWFGHSAADALVTWRPADVIPPRPGPAVGYKPERHNQMCKEIYPGVTDTALRYLGGM